MVSRSLTRAYHSKSAGAVNLSEAQIDKSDAAARVLVESLPVGAVILNAYIDLIEAFNAGTSNLLTMGYGAIAAATADDLVATVTEGTPGLYPGVVAPATPLAKLAAAQDIYLYYTPGAAGATTGRARGYLVWARTADNG